MVYEKMKCEIGKINHPLTVCTKRSRDEILEAEACSDYIHMLVSRRIVKVLRLADVQCVFEARACTMSL
ncbi:hypothetical protein IDH45_20460 [Paenibacillus sp. IB182363]|uniref:Uncharacterized protein n=1 Tax=Paenibacillus oceani TaxID=2772510 RepID=A0A927H1M6_9BACL|nr:hypothetical protein [Paenibacillus oceani]